MATQKHSPHATRWCKFLADRVKEPDFVRAALLFLAIPDSKLKPTAASLSEGLISAIDNHKLGWVTSVDDGKPENWDPVAEVIDQNAPADDRSTVMFICVESKDGIHFVPNRKGDTPKFLMAIIEDIYLSHRNNRAAN